MHRLIYLCTLKLLDMWKSDTILGKYPQTQIGNFDWINTYPLTNSCWLLTDFKQYHKRRLSFAQLTHMKLNINRETWTSVANIFAHIYLSDLYLLPQIYVANCKYCYCWRTINNEYIMDLSSLCSLLLLLLWTAHMSGPSNAQTSLWIWISLVPFFNIFISNLKNFILWTASV